MQTTRRQFIQTSVGGAFAMSLSRTFSATTTPAKTVPIGFQLYTVRAAFARNVPETLQKLGEIGYKGVEFWGYGGTPKVYQHYGAADLRKMLDDNGLKCCGIHLELKAVAQDNLKRTIENNQVLGSHLLNVAAAEDKMKSEESIAELAGMLNEAAVASRAAKMRIGYHAHPFDFVKINGRFAWELLFRRTYPEINMQMDVGNCLAGKGDPLAMLKEFPGRTWSIHIKEHEDKTFDSDYYKQVFNLCENACGTEWYIVEMGDQDGNAFDIPRQALAKLHRLGK